MFVLWTVTGMVNLFCLITGHIVFCSAVLVWYVVRMTDLMCLIKHTHYWLCVNITCIVPYTCARNSYISKAPSLPTPWTSCIYHSKHPNNCLYKTADNWRDRFPLVLNALHVSQTGYVREVYWCASSELKASQNSFLNRNCFLLKSINDPSIWISKFSVYCEFFNAISELLGHTTQLHRSVMIHFSGFHTMIVEIQDQFEVVFFFLN